MQKKETKTARWQPASPIAGYAVGALPAQVRVPMRLYPGRDGAREPE